MSVAHDTSCQRFVPPSSIALNRSFKDVLHSFVPLADTDLQSFTYALSDIIVDQAERYGMIMRCHNLVWHQSLPSWVTSTRWDNATLLAIMVNHIANVVSHFRGKCYAWDVVNEALYTDGTFRGSSNRTTEATSIWYTTIGPAYIPIAFSITHAVDPLAKLYYNDYNIESLATQAPKINGVINMVKLIRAYRVPIHGIGLQAHFAASNLPDVSDLVSALTSFTSMGLEVAYTELDVKSPKANPDRAGEALGYSNAVQACLQVPQCKGWTVWGFTEKYSWLGSFVPPYEGDLFDTSGFKTPSYYAALNTLPTCWSWPWIDWFK